MVLLVFFSLWHGHNFNAPIIGFPFRFRQILHSDKAKCGGVGFQCKKFTAMNIFPKKQVNKQTNKLPAVIYLLKVHNRNTRTKCEVCSKLTIKKPERRYWPHWCRSGVFIVNFKYISHIVSVFLLLTVSK